MQRQLALRVHQSHRRGATLAETLVALTILGILSAAALRLTMSQARFVDQTLKRREARAVSRASLNLLLSELRMVESSGGVAAATPRAITVRVPYALGTVCGSTTSSTVVSLLPSDSVAWAGAAFSGYAWRKDATAYVYQETGTGLTLAGNGPTCTSASIKTLPVGRIVEVTPPLPTSASAGTPIFLFQRLRYEFAPSDAFAGRTGLWRLVVNSGRREELAAPFDTTVRFRFFRSGSDTSWTTPPGQLANLRGLELLLTGESATPRLGAKQPERSTLRTAIFFTNRPQ